LTDLAPIGQGRALSVNEAQAVSAAMSRALRRAARQSRQPAPIIVGGGGRARKGDRAFRLGIIASFIAIVLIPALVATVYWGVVASKQYASEAKFTLRSGESSSLDVLGGFAGLPSSRQAQDTQVLVNYIESPAIIESLKKTVDLKTLYGDESIDHFSRLSPDASREKIEKYWRKRVDVKVDSNSGIVTLNVRAFTARDSEMLASKIVRLSESLVNDMAERPRHSALSIAEVEFRQAEENLRNATNAMRDARNTQGVLDANASAEAINKVVTVLQLQLSETESALAALGPQAPEAPQSRILQVKISKLKQQIGDYQAQIAGGREGVNMADRLSALSKYQTDLEIARQRYAQASAAYQSARVDIETQRAYVVAFLNPILAQESTYPRRWLEWLLVVLPAFLLWSLGAAIAFQARDNMAK
jgi:capsular polysaccharide transport system permease protein